MSRQFFFGKTIFFKLNHLVQSCYCWYIFPKRQDDWILCWILNTHEFWMLHVGRGRSNFWTRVCARLYNYVNSKLWGNIVPTYQCSQNLWTRRRGGVIRNNHEGGCVPTVQWTMPPQSFLTYRWMDELMNHCKKLAFRFSFFWMIE